MMRVKCKHKCKKSGLILLNPSDFNHGLNKMFSLSQKRKIIIIIITVIIIAFLWIGWFKMKNKKYLDYA